MLDLKPCDLMDPPYLNAQISDLSDPEEDVRLLIIYSSPSTNFTVLWQIMNRIQNVNIRPTSTQSTGDK